jgi:hypothetical protein
MHPQFAGNAQPAGGHYSLGSTGGAAGLKRRSRRIQGRILKRLEKGLTGVGLTATR